MACSYNSSIGMSANFKPPLLFILLACVYRLRGRGGGEGGDWVPQITVAALFGRPYGHHTPEMEWRNEVCH